MIKSQKKREEYQEFAYELKRARNRMLLYQAPFAKMTKISLATLRGWEQGYNLPNQENFKKIIEIRVENGAYTRTLEEAYIKARSSR